MIHLHFERWNTLNVVSRFQWIVSALFVMIFIASGCKTGESSFFPTSTPIAKKTILPTQTIQLSATESFIPLPSSTLESKSVVTEPTATLAPNAWQMMPVIPEVSETARLIYQYGLQRGVNPEAFSKIGDCESRTTWFLYDFDQGPQYYDLGPYTYLEPVIDHFKGSFGRLSQVAKPGFTAAAVMTPLWADPAQCQKNETPLACEYRQQNPAFSFIMLGTNDVARPETFEANMRRVIEFTIDQGIVPILATKADNLEGDHQINATIARLAYEYDIPLWNFWLAVQDLPDKGLQPDGAHLTWSPNHFGDPEVMKRAWPVRNLTALQTLDVVWRGVTQ